MNENPIVIESFFVAVNAMCVEGNLTLFKVPNQPKRLNLVNVERAKMPPKITTFNTLITR